MPKPQKEPLRVLGEQERQELQRIVRATSERMDVIKRARALLAVARGQSFSAAAREAGFASSDTVRHLVARFNRPGLLALLIAAGRGRKPTYSHEDRQKIVETLKSEPVRKVDASATWSLSLLQQKLRETGLTYGRSQHHRSYAASSRLCLWAQPNLVPDRNGPAQAQRGRGACAGPENRGKKSVIEWAYQAAARAGIRMTVSGRGWPLSDHPLSGE